MSRKNNNNNVKLNDDAKDFAKLTLKKFKKKQGDYFDSKKELREAYEMTLIDLLPKTIEAMVKYGHIQNQDVQDTKIEIYKKINDPDFIKLLKKEIKHGNDIENIKLLSIIIKEILLEANKANTAALAENPNAKIYDVSDLIELVQIINKKKLKKFEKAGINDKLAFDMVSIIPCDSALESSQFYRIHMLYDTMYEHSKSITVPFEKIMDILVGEDYYPVFIVFALLERKEKFSKLTDNQKALYLDITNWCFKIMESLSREEIEKIINLYVSSRKKDEAQGKDSNRRFPISSLSANDYERINKVVNRMISDDPNIKKYL